MSIVHIDKTYSEYEVGDFYLSDDISMGPTFKKVKFWSSNKLGTYKLDVSNLQENILYSQDMLMQWGNLTKVEDQSFNTSYNGTFLVCECGAHKTHGKDCPTDAHSAWCPLYVKGTTTNAN